jgi:peptidyl-tRNA hydrolase, PTH1 family
MILIVGLGNPGSDYENTRHNAGRNAAILFAKKYKMPAFEYDKKSNALLSYDKIEKTPVTIALPETYMNKSGQAVAKLTRIKKDMKDLIVMHDDLDIPVSSAKMTYGRNSGGHKGVESIMRAIKTKNFVRIRIGVAPKKKPTHKKILDFIVGNYSPKEKEALKKLQRKINLALETTITNGYPQAMNEFNKQ